MLNISALRVNDSLLSATAISFTTFTYRINRHLTRCVLKVFGTSRFAPKIKNESLLLCVGNRIKNVLQLLTRVYKPIR